MKKLSNPRDLLVAQLSELLWIERRLAFDVLPEMIDQAHDQKLVQLFAGGEGTEQGLVKLATQN